MDNPLQKCASLFVARGPARHASRAGVALVMTLGLLALICVAVIAFIAAMRLERSTARLEADRATLRGLHHAALASAMQNVSRQAVLEVSMSDGSSQLYGRVYPVTWQDYDNADEPGQPLAPPSAGPCLGSFYKRDTNVSFSASSIRLFTGAATNLVPGAVQADAASVESIWMPVTSVLADPNESGESADPLAPLMDTVVMSRVAYLIIDCSGFLPPVSTTAAQIHLPPERRDHTFYLAHDPDPEQFYTVKPEYVTNTPPSPGLYSTLVTNKFDVNSWTNDLPTWLAGVKAGFFAAGFTNAPDKLAWNLKNMLDEDRIPQYDAADPSPPSRVTYGFENLPMINEVAVHDEGSGAYSVSVELWYPFEPEQSPEGLVLAVGVYTNRTDIPPITPSFPGPFADLGPFSFTNVVPLLYSPGRPFHVAKSARQVVFTPPIFGPIYVWPRLYLLDTNTTPAVYVCVDEALIVSPTGSDNVDIIDNFDNIDILKWTTPGSWQASNPFFNLLAGADDFGGAPTLWTTNSNLDPGFESPLFHLNRPMLSAGELGYLGLAQPGTGTVSLATAEGAALLDRFTTLPANRAEKASASRIQPNSPYPEVIAELFRNPVFSRPIDDADIPQPETLTNAWFEARAAWTNAYPNASWNTFEELLPAIASTLSATNDPQQVEDLLRGVADQTTFRQNLYVIIVAAQRLSPPIGTAAQRVLADQRAAITVIRDAYTGRWAIHDWCPLTE
jgi:hypothetical protein